MDLQEISDRMEIREVITRYTRAIDTRQWDGLDSVFTDDAILDYSAVDGPADVLAVARPWVIQGLSGFARYQHTIGQIAIEFEPAAVGGAPQRAKATAYFINPMVSVQPDGSESFLEVGGYYHHEMVRTENGWRSARMVDDNVYYKF